MDLIFPSFLPFLGFVISIIALFSNTGILGPEYVDVFSVGGESLLQEFINFNLNISIFLDHLGCLPYNQLLPCTFRAMIVFNYVSLMRKEQKLI